jgi:hypothetical protein
MMVEFLIQLITSAAVSTALAAALLWLSRLWISERLKSAIKSEYDQKLETHKAQLKAQSDIEIERLRSQLSIAATEHEVRFFRLHEKRGEVIAETYKLLQDLHQRLANYVSIIEFSNDPPREERRGNAVSSHKLFIDFYAKNTIFLPKTTAKMLDSINSQCVDAFNEFALNIDKQEEAKDSTQWLRIFQRVKGEIRIAMDQLEDEFRRLLGDTGSVNCSSSER